MPIYHEQQLLLAEVGRLLAAGSACWPAEFSLRSPGLFAGHQRSAAAQLIEAAFHEAAMPSWTITLVEPGLALQPHGDRLYFMLDDRPPSAGELLVMPDGADLVSVSCDKAPVLRTELAATAEAVAAWRRWAAHGPAWRNQLAPARASLQAANARLCARMEALMERHPDDERVRWLGQHGNVMAQASVHGLMLWHFLRPLHKEPDTANPFVD